MCRLLKTCRLLLVFLVASVLLVACGGSGTGDKTGSVTLSDGNGAISGGTTNTGSGNSNQKPVDLPALTNDTQFMYVQRTVSKDAQARKDKFNQAISTLGQTPLEVGSPYDFNPGAKLINRSSLDVDGIDTEVLTSYFGSSEYDVKDLNVSADGQLVVFAAHGPASNSHDHTWNIYEYSFKAKTVRRIIKDDAIANAGEDTNPTYAADGSIVFSSDRNAGNPNSPVDDIVDGDQIGKCTKIPPSDRPSLLHSMTNQGEHILQLTFGKNIDTKPTTLKDGRIAFVRLSRGYEVLNCPADGATGTFDSLLGGVHTTGLESPSQWSSAEKCALAKATPDGRVLISNNYTILRITADGKEIQQLYKKVTLSGGADSFVAPDHIIQAENGRLMTVISHQYNTFLGGNLLELQSPDTGASDKVFGNLAPRSLINGEIDLYPGQSSVKGWYSAVWPYRDGTGRLLVSWSQCSAVVNGVSSFCNSDSTTGDVNSQYGIWVLDQKTNSRLPVVRVRKDVVYSDLVIAQPNNSLDYPFGAFDAKFVDDLDQSRIVCETNSSSSYSSYSSYSSSESSSYVSSDASSSYASYSSAASSEASSYVTVSVASSSVASSVVASSSVASSVAPSSVAASSVVALSSSASSVAPSSVAASSVVALSSSASSVAPSSVAASSVVAISSSASSVAPSSIATSSLASSLPVASSSVASSVVMSSSSISSVHVNHAPVANAGSDQPVAIGSVITLDGSGSNDADGDALTYRWTIITPKTTTVRLSDSSAVMPTLAIKDHGVYVVQLIVNDGKVDSAPDTVSFEVGNIKPVANAGVDKIGEPGTVSLLDGTLSSDMDGDPLTYQWRVVSAPDASVAQIVNSTDVKPTFTPDKYGVYTLELVVSDGIVNSDPDTVVIDTRNGRPIADAGLDQSVVVDELALLNGTGSSDPEGQTLKFTWSILSKPAGSTTSLINPNEDMPQIKIDKAGSYVVQLIVNDGVEDSAPDTVVLNTKNIRPIAEAGITQTVYVGDVVKLDGSASSDPDGDKISYRWSLANKPSTSSASINNATTVSPQFTADKEGTYVAQLIVNDGALDSAPDTVTINVQQKPCDISNDTRRTIPVTIRDFDKSHPDFEKFDGIDYGIVSENLDADSLPVYARPTGKTKTTSGAANFNQWYRDVTGINIKIPKTLQMSREAGKTVWSYTNDNFFPIDGLGFGNMPKPYPDHNFHFTLETHMEFDYTGGEVFTFRGDDDLWVFINGKLAIDIGGVHGVIEKSINLNDRAAYLGIQKGKKYHFDLFFAERHTYKSNFMFQTNINLECTPH